MFFGFGLYAFLHIVISLIGIASGLVVLWGMLNNKRLDRWTAVFIGTTVYTNASGFGFPFFRLLPSHTIGGISLIILSVTIVARYYRHMAGNWRWLYVVTAVAALYFNVFVLIVQLFRRVPALIALAPTQSEPPFAVVQGIVLVLFVWLGVRAVKRFHPEVSAGSVP